VALSNQLNLAQSTLLSSALRCAIQSKSSNLYELSAFTKEHLIYTPAQLAVKPKYEGDVEIVIDERGATHG
jgi:hypothetical protein